LQDVDDGSTVTDYLPEERARGITITAAAITFPWANHTINLIDTPGHADFTFEVSRSLRVLDGAVAVLDGVAGVEAQTEKVWRQADGWDLSRLVFVNKMDREGAGFGRTVREIASRLGAKPLVMQLPVFEGGTEGGRFLGVLDLVDMTVLTWHLKSDRAAAVTTTALHANSSQSLVEEARVARTALIETLGELDDTILELYLRHEDPTNIPPSSIRMAVRSLTLQRAIVPVFCGSSLRGVGVQPLLDAVVNYLPSPLDRPVPSIVLAGEDKMRNLESVPNGVCALAFKVIHDPSRGPLVFVRVYQGSITRGMTLVNTRTRGKEKANRLLRMYADESVELDSIPEGNIGVVLGLKNTTTGDTIINKRPEPLFHLQPIETPPPVFIASVELDSLGEAKSVSDALAQLLREDPSLTVSTDEDSGQILLGGMGELHLEIARDRLVNEMGAKCEMSKVRVSYRETIGKDAFSRVEKAYEREIGGKLTKVALAVEVSSLDPSKPPQSPQRNRHHFWEFGNLIDVDLARAHGFDGLEPDEVLDALCAGARAVLQIGPSLHLPLHSVHLKFNELMAFENQTNYQSIATAARLATKEALKRAASSGESALMEPFMKVLLTVHDGDVGTVINDLTSARGGMIFSMDSTTATNEKQSSSATTTYAPPDSTYQQTTAYQSHMLTTIVARVPLKEMVGYSKTFRSLTQGRGTFVMTLEGFEKMTEQRAGFVQNEI